MFHVPDRYCLPCGQTFTLSFRLFFINGAILHLPGAHVMRCLSHRIKLHVSCSLRSCPESACMPRTRRNRVMNFIRFYHWGRFLALVTSHDAPPPHVHLYSRTSCETCSNVCWHRLRANVGYVCWTPTSEHIEWHSTLSPNMQIQKNNASIGTVATALREIIHVSRMNLDYCIASENKKSPNQSITSFRCRGTDRINRLSWQFNNRKNARQSTDADYHHL